MIENAILHADMLSVLPSLPSGCASLVYFDPPFNSGFDYCLPSGEVAFTDRWRFDEQAKEHFEQASAVEALSPVMSLFRMILNETGTLAYVSAMACYIHALERLLGDSGSFCLHCDPSHSHFLRLILDAVMGQQCWRNTIVWRYRRWPAPSKSSFQRMHDDLLFYSRPGSVFNTLYGFESLAESTQKAFGGREQKADFSSGRRKPSTTDKESKGPALSDVWPIGMIAPSGNERTGYPTQKPEKLLERVILATTQPEDLVVDPACGSGTACVVARVLGRKFLGIDRSPQAFAAATQRVKDDTRWVLGALCE